MNICSHEQLIPRGKEWWDSTDWNLMNWDEEPGLKVNICKKCMLLYATRKEKE